MLVVRLSKHFRGLEGIADDQGQTHSTRSVRCALVRSVDVDRRTILSIASDPESPLYTPITVRD